MHDPGETERVAPVLHLPPAAEEGIRLFNAGFYFEAHDLLEEVWIERGGLERQFYQGLIQVAVALYKIAGKNQGGAVSLFRKGLPKLRAAQELETPIDLERLIAETEAALARVEALGQSRIGEFDLAAAPRIHPKIHPKKDAAADPGRAPEPPAPTPEDHA
jgi:predicted metal-dependent hydrolase